MTGISIDCPDVINFATGLKMDTQQSVYMSEIRSNCCAAYGVTCNSQRVTNIKWNGINLNGVINGTALISCTKLVQLEMTDNQIKGEIPRQWPSSLVFITLFNNQLTGNISVAWPLSLVQLSLQDNQLSGDIPSVWPSTQGAFWAWSNQFTGIPRNWTCNLDTIDLNWNNIAGNLSQVWPARLATLSMGSNSISGKIQANWPSTLTSLSIGSNLLTGTVPSNWPSGISGLGIENNFLTGSLPYFPTSLQYLYVAQNQITGTLKLDLPISFDIGSNFITDIDIGSTKFITFCDISNNPLLASPHLLNLTMCIQNGLYKMSLSTANTASSIKGATTPVLAKSTTISRLRSTTSSLTIENTGLHSISKSLAEVIATLRDIGIASSVEGVGTTNLQELSREITEYHPQSLQNPFSIEIFLRNLVKLLVDSILLFVILSRAPLGREFKKKFRLRILISNA